MRVRPLAFLAAPLAFQGRPAPDAFHQGPQGRPQAPTASLGMRREGAADDEMRSGDACMWDEAAGLARKAARKRSTREIVRVGNTTGDGFETAFQDLISRAENTGWDTRLILGRKGDEDSQQVGIGPLTKAFVMKKYEEELGAPIGSIVFSGANASVSDDFVSRAKERLSDGGQIGVVVVGPFHGHSASIIIGLDRKQNELHAVSLDSIQVKSTDAKHRAALEPLRAAVGADLVYKPGASSVSQADASSCNTLSCIMLRDMLRNATSDFAVTFQVGDPAPISTLKTAQREEYLVANAYNESFVYSEKKNRTLGDHRNDHSVAKGGERRFHYLKAKSMQYISAMLERLEGFSGPQDRDRYAKNLLEEAYPGNRVVQLMNATRSHDDP